MEGLEVLNLCWTAIKEVPSSIVLLKNLKELIIRGWKLSEFYFLPESPEWLTSLFLPTGLTTERILLPSYIYSSVQTSPAPVGLSLPSLSESMSQLSNLRSLYLEGCKRLQSLENVPSTIESIIADNCISLERLPKLQYYRFRLDRADLQFLFLNCFKLVDNRMLQGVNNMLQVSLSLSLFLSLQVLNVMLCIFQGQSGTLPMKLKIIIPRSEIPKYFNHECTGHELKVQVPSNWSNAPIGIAFCVVFVPNYWLECPHNWVLSFIIDGIPRASSRHLKVEKIGVRFIYLQDIEIPSKTMVQCINNSSIVVHHDIDDSIAEGSGNKRSRDEDDGAVPSGECCFIVEPPPKGIQRLGGFMEDSEDPSLREFSDFFAMDAEDQTSKKLEAIHECSSFQEIEDINQTLAKNSNNSSTPYEGLGEIYRDIERFSRQR
ncbi:disease resistance-like protein CSA1 isoform X3 [Quercus suber]|uniref:disease resistance-like protein CSA1 isoform X3 n=1 Tax=Quercus suber TaxID=58331 RepID=UPI0032DFC635